MQRSVAQSFQPLCSLSQYRFPRSDSFLWFKNIKHQKCISVSFYSPVLYRQLWGDGKDFIGPRSQCQRARQWAVDAAACRRHLWPCRIGENPYRPVRWGDALHGDFPCHKRSLINSNRSTQVITIINVYRPQRRGSARGQLRWEHALRPVWRRPDAGHHWDGYGQQR